MLHSFTKRAQFDRVALKPPLPSEITQYISKEAKEISVHFTPVDDIQKTAFASAMMDPVTKAKTLIKLKTGVDDQMAGDFASPVVRKANQILSTHGGTEDQVMEQLIDALADQIRQNPSSLQQLTKNPIDHTSITGTKKIEETIGENLVRQLGMTRYDADYNKKIIANEARHLTLVLRPYTTLDIGNAIVSLIHQEGGDVRVAYNIKDNTNMLERLRALLTGGGAL